MRRGTVFYGAKRLGFPGLLGLSSIFLIPLGVQAAPLPNVNLEGIASLQTQDELAQEADGILQELSVMRGVPITRKVKLALADKEFFARYYLRRLQSQYPSPEKENDEAAFRALGLLGKNDDLITTYLRLFLTLVQGLYDPDTKTLYLLRGISPGNQERVMAHELVHALQDMQFDLGSELREQSSFTLDEQFARTAMIEGEAEGLSLDWKLREEGKDFTRIGDIAPWVELGQMLERNGLKAVGKRALSADPINFPYVYGVTFFQRWVRLHGWKSAGEVYQNPPRSTQQIIELNGYCPKPLPFVRVELEDLTQTLLRDYRLIWKNSLGEYGWESVLGNYVEKEEASRAVQGWKGDGVQAYEATSDSSILLTSYLSFRDDQSSEAFFKAAEILLKKKVPIQSWIRSDEGICWVLLADQKEAYLERFGKRVICLEGVPQGLTPRLRASLWDLKGPEP